MISALLGLINKRLTTATAVIQPDSDPNTNFLAQSRTALSRTETLLAQSLMSKARLATDQHSAENTTTSSLLTRMKQWKPVASRPVTPGVALRNQISSEEDEGEDCNAQVGRQDTPMVLTPLPPVRSKHFHHLPYECEHNDDDEPVSVNPYLAVEAPQQEIATTQQPSKSRKRPYTTFHQGSSGSSSPIDYDNIYMQSRAAKSWGLVRPEDKKGVLITDRRRKSFRESPVTIWLRELNEAVIHADSSKVLQLMRQYNGGIASHSQLESLVRCSAMRADWKSIALLLFYGKRHINQEREVVAAMRDLVAIGTSNRESIGNLVSAQQMCAQLIATSYSKLPRFTSTTGKSTPSVHDLVFMCRNDDLVSLSAAFLEYQSRGLVVDGFEFSEMETSVQLAPLESIPSVSLPLAVPHERKRQRIIGESYCTPTDKAITLNFDSEDFDNKLAEEFKRDVLPFVFNGRYASLIEFATVICAPRCMSLLSELSARRLV